MIKNKNTIKNNNKLQRKKMSEVTNESRKESDEYIFKVIKSGLFLGLKCIMKLLCLSMIFSIRSE